MNGTCKCGKIRHLSQKTATRAARRLVKKSIKVKPYFCDIGKSWHTGGGVNKNRV